MTERNVFMIMLSVIVFGVLIMMFGCATVLQASEVDDLKAQIVGLQLQVSGNSRRIEKLETHLDALYVAITGLTMKDFQDRLDKKKGLSK